MIEKDESANTPKKKSNALKYIICFILFFAVGTVLGIYCTNRYLEAREKSGIEPAKKEEDNILDITDNKDYENIIANMRKVVNNNIFYVSTGINLETMSNEAKLTYVYNYVIDNKLYTEDSINATWGWGSTTCDYDFLVETASNDDGSTYSTGACAVKRLNENAIVDSYKTIFNVTNIEVPSEFIVNDNTKCITDETGMLCGTVASETGVTGDITPKFEIVKVEQDKDNTIYLYEKGYLVDTRSNIVNSEDGYDNYYLHSTDATQHYYELKSSDNLTFKHTFKTTDKQNYYYVSTEVVPKEENDEE